MCMGNTNAMSAGKIPSGREMMLKNPKMAPKLPAATTPLPNWSEK